MEEELRKIIAHYGKDLQLNQVVEEMSELTKEVCKHKRGKENRAEIVEEFVDVTIMLMQLCIIFDIQDSELDNIADKKIAIVLERIAKESATNE